MGASGIRARAVRRCGELLKEIPAKSGDRKGGGTPAVSERAAAAKQAGLSTDQTKDALRVARVPRKDFEDPWQGSTDNRISPHWSRKMQEVISPRSHSRKVVSHPVEVTVPVRQESLPV